MEQNKRILIKKDNSKDIDLSSCFDFELISISLCENASAKVYLPILNNINKDIKIRVSLKDNSSIDFFCADFDSSSHKITSLIKLEGEGSKATWNMSCLSKENEDKSYDISFIHEAKNTSSKMNNYGVALDSSSLKFKGVSHIQQDAAKSSASQEAKIIVFDDDVKASSSPSLRIDNNDINASHSAIVGRLNEDHLYYLMSRGLTIDAARRLITTGYLLPIANYFNEDIKKDILEKINGRL